MFKKIMAVEAEWFYEDKEVSEDVQDYPELASFQTQGKRYYVNLAPEEYRMVMQVEGKLKWPKLENDPAGLRFMLERFKGSALENKEKYIKALEEQIKVAG